MSSTLGLAIAVIGGGAALPAVIFGSDGSAAVSDSTSASADDTDAGSAAPDAGEGGAGGGD